AAPALGGKEKKAGKKKTPPHQSFSRHDVQGLKPEQHPPRPQSKTLHQRHRRTRSTSLATFAGDVSGTIPCPRLKMNGFGESAVRISSTRRSITSPPTANKSGSRLPCTTARPDNFAAIKDRGIGVSQPMPSSNVCF